MEKTDSHNVRVIPATQELINSMKGRIRKSDINEVWASSHMDIDEALDLSFRASENSVVKLFDDKVEMAAGVVRPFLLSSSGIIWMLATDAAENKSIKISIIRTCKKYINEMLQGFNELTNFVDVRNTTSINWLKWCGFTLEEPKPYGPENMLFRKFYIRRNS